MDPTYPAFPVLSFVGFVIVLIPVPWHFQSWNSGTCLYMGWTALGLLNLFINSIVWRNSAINYAPVWCDISSRIMVGVAVALPAASLCINRRLYKIATISSVTVSRAEKRRAIFIDLAIGIGIPIMQMILQFIVEGHRFDIYEELGCYPYTYNTPLAYLLSFTWPLVIGVFSAVYCILTLRAFMKRRSQFSEFLSATNTLNINRYFRLMALATVELLCTIPISAYGIYINANVVPIEPWKGFADAHYDYSRVGQYPAVIWRMNSISVVSAELTRWSLVFCAFVFFAFFGFADEARKNYRKARCAIAKRLGTEASATRPFATIRPLHLVNMNSVGSLPIYLPHSAGVSGRGSISTHAEHDNNSSPATDEFESCPPQMFSSDTKDAAIFHC